MKIDKPKNILIVSPILPPEIGGPASYAKMLENVYEEKGFGVSLIEYGLLKKFPTGLRHFLFGLKIIPSVLWADYVIGLDSYSVGLPAVVICRVFFKKIIIRLGGDFLWETYLERTKEKILLSDFYLSKRNFSLKEKYIFVLTKMVLKYSNASVFSTAWQSEIFLKPYNLQDSKIFIISNKYIKIQQRNIVPKERIILSPSRDIFLKNKSGLKNAFQILQKTFTDISLDTGTYSVDELKNKMLESYCLVVPSFSEVSPNIVLEALSLGIPVVVTEDCGIKNVLGDVVVWVDPKNSESIAQGMETLLDSKIYEEYLKKISDFSYSQSPENIADEFLSIFQKI